MRIEVDADGKITEHEDAPIISPTAEQILDEKVAEAKAYIAITDWVEPYILRHELGLFVLPNDSNKLVIKSMRDEKIEFIRKNDVSV